MLGNIRWWVAGLVLALVMSGTAVLVYTVLIPIVHTALLPHTGPLMAPICPGNPKCG